MIRRSPIGALLLGLLIAGTGAAGLAIAQVQVQPALSKTATSSPAIRVEEGPRWSSLSQAQQASLEPLRVQWPSIEASRKAKWLVVASRFPSMPAAERERVRARMAEWARMSPTERGRARQNFQELRNLAPDDRQALWDAYKALPEQQRQELATRTAKAASAPDPRVVAGKRNVVTAHPQTASKSIAPTVVQAKPGATTTLVTKPPAPPVHHQPGLPKIAATNGFVNPSTLLPSRGPQGAAVPASASSAEPGT